MCTLSVIRRASGVVRLVCNRDEQRTRLRSRGPEVRELGARRAIMPIDANAGGTWIGVNDLGVAACLINASVGRGDIERGAMRSRGEIVPRALMESTLRGAAASVLETSAGDYPPFRVLVCDVEGAVVLASDGRRVARVEELSHTSAVMLTSSGLGDEVVEGPRRAVFEEMVAAGFDQDAFHARRCEGAGHLGVAMARADARTVSRTSIELGEALATLEHAWLGEDLEVESRMTARLGLVRGSVAGDITRAGLAGMG